MTSAEIRQKYLDFFSDKVRQHAVISSASLLPENDPTTLFTGSGMQPMISYLLGATHPLGTRIVDSQKCFRAQDIEEVGDNRHTTMFEMLGNWSLGDYFKHEQIPWMFEFLTSCLELDPKKLFVTVFRGNEALGIGRDVEAVQLWKEQFAKVGIEAKDVDFSERDGMNDGRIFYYDEKKNWWSRSGVPSRMPVGEPGGPDTEMFWDFEADRGLHEVSSFASQPCHVNCDCGRFMEIGNNVFMEYKKTEQGFERLAQKNVDFGGGLERMAAAQANNPDIFLTDVFTSLITAIEAMSGKRYGQNVEITHSFRVIADHIRAATFLIGDPRGVSPSNVGQGYVVRRLLRRAIREGRNRLGISEPFTDKIAEVVIAEFGEHYAELKANREHILAELKKEEEKFGKTLDVGLKRLRKLVEEKIDSSRVGHRLPAEFRGLNVISGYEAFDLYQSYGFPIEMVLEELQKLGRELRGIPFDFDVTEFQEAQKRHQELSQTASAGAFKGGLADSSAETTRLHTATHLLHKALKKVLGDHVEQKGSNITAERLRFDFSHPQKMTPEEISMVEQIVNEVIKEDLPVHFEEMSVEQAKGVGAIGLFEEKYGDKVKVYFVGDGPKNFSSEICGGPHVANTCELGAFKIQKEEAVSAGVRRIKATVTGPTV